MNRKDAVGHIGHNLGIAGEAASSLVFHGRFRKAFGFMDAPQLACALFGGLVGSILLKRSLGDGRPSRQARMLPTWLDQGSVFVDGDPFMVPVVRCGFVRDPLVPVSCAVGTADDLSACEASLGRVLPSAISRVVVPSAMQAAFDAAEGLLDGCLVIAPPQGALAGLAPVFDDLPDRAGDHVELVVLGRRRRP